MTKHKIHWGVIGTANIGREKVIPGIQKSSNGEVTAIASRNLEQAEKTAKVLNIGKAYGSYEALLADPDIDAVYIPLPNHLHVEWAIKAIRANKHVLCEKPIGLSSAEAKELAASAEKHPKIKVMEAFMYRFHPQWKKVKDAVDAGLIGEVKTINSFFSYFNADPHNIRNQADIGGGALMDIGCYCISFPRFLFSEEPIRVVSSIERDPVMKTDRLVSALLEFPKGQTSTFTCSTQLMSYQRMHVFGDKGHIEIEIPVNAPKDAAIKVWIRTQGGTEEIIIEPVDQYTLQAEAFAKAVLENTLVPTPLTDAINNMKTIEALFKSETESAWISINPSNAKTPNVRGQER